MEPQEKPKGLISVPLRDNDAKEILWRMYQENYNNARHYESQRSTVTNFIILIAGGVGTIASSGGFAPQDLPLTLLLVGLGFFGALFSASYYERYKRSKERAKAHLRELDLILFEEEIFKKIKIAVDDERRRKHPLLDKLYDVHWLWMALPLMVAILGLALSYVCWSSLGEPKSTKVVLVDESGKPLAIEQSK